MNHHLDDLNSRIETLHLVVDKSTCGKEKRREARRTLEDLRDLLTVATDTGEVSNSRILKARLEKMSFIEIRDFLSDLNQAIERNGFKLSPLNLRHASKKVAR